MFSILNLSKCLVFENIILYARVYYYNIHLKRFKLKLKLSVDDEEDKHVPTKYK